MNKKLYICVGVSGSGKSTYVEKLKETHPNLCVCSADHFMMKGEAYDFKPEKLGFAHRECLYKAHMVGMANGLPVVIDNTNVRFSDFSPYLRAAAVCGYSIEFIVFDVSEDRIQTLVERNVHKVPKDVIVRQYNNLTECRKSLRRNMKTNYPELAYTIITIPFQETSNG